MTATDGLPGFLHGVRVVELASEAAAFAGKLLADLGADVILVEPPGGHATRGYEPFLDDQPGPERSLFFWHYNTSKRGVVLDLDSDDGRASFRSLVAGADIVLEAEPVERLGALGVDQTDLRAADPSLIWVSVTPYGRQGPVERNREPLTDLTLMAGAGPVWSSGYDDHTLPPVRGGGNQGYQTGSVIAVAAALTTLVHRDAGGPGQHVDVSLHAANNVTTEAASYTWLVSRQTVQRMTCRHASVNFSAPVLHGTLDGRFVHTGVPPRHAREYQNVLDWLEDRGLADEYPETFFLRMGVERGGVAVWEMQAPGEAREIYGAGRDALKFLAERSTARQFFLEGQNHAVAVGELYAPEDVMADEHFRARGFAVPVHHAELGRDIEYPGLPFTGTAAGGGLRRAPLLGEHQADLAAPWSGPKRA